MSSTIDYYNSKAEAFFGATVGVDMSALHARFLAAIPAGGLILDAGCGAGRDSKAFLERGYRVVAFDAAVELCRLAAAHIGQPVALRRFEEVTEVACYDGVWACASLLHVPAAEIHAVLARLWAALKPGGVFYLSFKLGDLERTSDGRHFTDATEARLRDWLRPLPEVAVSTCWISADQRPERAERWLNALLGREAAAGRKLIAGGARDHLLPHLCDAIGHADEIDFAVAFITLSGLRLLLPDLQAVLRPPAERGRAPARLRIVTSDYLDFTDPAALRLLMLLQAEGAQVRVFEAREGSFHVKAYLCAQFVEQRHLHGTAFIGSSNISRQALTDGLEWNARLDYPGDEGFVEARARFELLFRHQRTRTLSDEWIEAYARRRRAPLRAPAADSEETEAPPVPTSLQQEALAALAATREEGYRRGLVVLATGLGKTWLAAFDAAQMGARRVLFVAHREEILYQAAETFLRLRPAARVGFYKGQRRDETVDVLCASIQTLGRSAQLARFAPAHFDYLVVDEFHHAAAPTYRRLLAHFAPRFLLGLTATPERTDQSDILSLCDDKLVFSRNLFAGIEAGLLAPFHYYGIFDESVDYRQIPWRSGRFDPAALAHKLATLARSRHALKEWKLRAQACTLAFCVSVSHAEFMAAAFREAGVACAAVYSGSALSRGDALDQLSAGRLQVIFSVDLFNEGVDLPGIDTVMLLRPTESKILFLQQLGRGLRRAPGKAQLVVLDFIGNHHSFLHKPQALLSLGANYRELAAFARQVERRELALPAGCFINYDLQLIAFLKSLDGQGVAGDYAALKESLGRRPTLAEFYRAGASVSDARLQYGSWFALVLAENDLGEDEAQLLAAHSGFLREVETTKITKSFKMVLLEAFQELDGWVTPPSLARLAEKSWDVLQRRRPLLGDLPTEELEEGTEGSPASWPAYWQKNPVKAWSGGKAPFFQVDGGVFAPAFGVSPAQRELFANLVQEVIDFRLAAYEIRKTAARELPGNVIPLPRPAPLRTELPYFPDLRIACGHFKSASTEAVEHRPLGAAYGRLDPARHFIARASGHSMDGGKKPIRDGDYLLLELIDPARAGAITGSVVAIEQQDEAGDSQYLLRVVTKARDGRYMLKANNAAYADLPATDEMRTLARLKGVLDPLALLVGEHFLREEIPALFGETFNPGNWNVGHVVLTEKKAQVLLVTLDKQGRAEDRRYLDHWIDGNTFHWQSQNATTPDSKRGREIIAHEKLGIAVHLFVREHKLAAGKAAPFKYCGPLRYVSHAGSAPLSVVFAVES